MSLSLFMLKDHDRNKIKSPKVTLVQNYKTLKIVCRGLGRVLVELIAINLIKRANNFSDSGKCGEGTIREWPRKQIRAQCSHRATDISYWATQIYHIWIHKNIILGNTNIRHWATHIYHIIFLQGNLSSGFGQ